MAVLCGVLILSVQFFLNFTLATLKMETGEDFARLLIIGEVVAVLAPTLLLTFALTRDPVRTLRLNPPGIADFLGRGSGSVRSGPMSIALPLLAAAGLALTLQPFTYAAQIVLTKLYPVTQELQQVTDLFEKLKALPPWAPYVLIGLVPAVCEEGLPSAASSLSGLRQFPAISGGRFW